MFPSKAGLVKEKPIGSLISQISGDDFVTTTVTGDGDGSTLMRMHLERYIRKKFTGKSYL